MTTDYWRQISEQQINPKYPQTYSYVYSLLCYINSINTVKMMTCFEKSSAIFKPDSGTRKHKMAEYLNKKTTLCEIIFFVRQSRRFLLLADIISHLSVFNPLNPELNPICYLLALLGAHHFLHVSRIRVKLLTFRILMSYIYGAPILDVSRSHTTTQHSR